MLFLTKRCMLCFTFVILGLLAVHGFIIPADKISTSSKHESQTPETSRIGLSNNLVKDSGLKVISLDKDVDLGEQVHKLRLHLDISITGMKEAAKMSDESSTEEKDLRVNPNYEEPSIEETLDEFKRLLQKSPTKDRPSTEEKDLRVNPNYEEPSIEETLDEFKRLLQKSPTKDRFPTEEKDVDVNPYYEEPTDEETLEEMSTNLQNSTTKDDPCTPNPCGNDGLCLQGEDPYGWGFYCSCQGLSGGRRCQIRDPCNENRCPEGTWCLHTHADDRGRFCYNTTTWQLVE